MALATKGGEGDEIIHEDARGPLVRVFIAATRGMQLKLRWSGMPRAASPDGAESGAIERWGCTESVWQSSFKRRHRV